MNHHRRGIEALQRDLYAWEAAVKLCRELAEEARQEAFDLNREAQSLQRHNHRLPERPRRRATLDGMD